MMMSQIDINTDNVIACGASTKYGINLNVAVDHDADQAAGSRTLALAISEIGSKRLR